mgnify:CR=1 FL=1
MNMKGLIEELYLTNRSFITEDYNYCLNYIDEYILSLQVHEFPSGKEVWDSWQIPKKWIVNQAYIKEGDKEILNYDNHPLHLIGYSDSYEGYISKEELKEHLHFHPELPEAIPWHFRLNYRPWDSEWGFCVSKEFYNSLNEEEYYVKIDTEFEDDYLKVAEHHLEGEKDETIVFIAHLDHTGMANDDLSGVAAGLEIMNRLKDKEERKYSYKLLIVQEMLGSAAYLEKHNYLADELKYGIFLEMLGNDNRIALQKSFKGNTKLDKIAKYLLEINKEEFKVGEFREIVCNDEIVFESPGYEIPTISISRYPYLEYHTNLDNPSIISQENLEEAVQYVLEVINILENDFVPIRKFEGLPSLANPKYDLYIDPGQKALSGSLQNSEDLNRFRDYIFRYLEGDYSVFEIAQEFNLSFEFVHDYLIKFNKKDLIEVK